MPENGVGWRGIHHVAVVTRNLKETMSFYEQVLGMSVGDVVERTAQGTVSRHCFIRPGESEGWGLHFFESPEAGPHVAAGKLDRESLMGTVGVQHIAFALPDEAAGTSLRERLKDGGWRLPREEAPARSETRSSSTTTTCCSKLRGPNQSNATRPDA